MKVLKNVKIKEEAIEEFPYVRILDNEDILVDLPIVAAEYGVKYKKPVLYGDYKGIPTIYEEEEVRKTIEGLKVFYFTEDQGKLTEVGPEKATIKARLPKDTPVDQLIFDRGSIVWAKPVEENKEVS